MDREGTATNGKMDNLAYFYYKKDNTTGLKSIYSSVLSSNESRTNQLAYVTETVPSTSYAEDIENQTNLDNYAYDAIGNLTEDKSEGLLIDWTPYGKIDHIRNNTNLWDEYFHYDPMGNRITKTMIDQYGNKNTTIYVRDAQGNLISTYKRTIDICDQSYLKDNYSWEELHLYGSSRLGIFKPSLMLSHQLYMTPNPCEDPHCNNLCYPIPMSCTYTSFDPNTKCIEIICQGNPMQYCPGDDEYEAKYIQYKVMSGGDCIYDYYDEANQCIYFKCLFNGQYISPWSICTGVADYDFVYNYYVRSKYSTHTGNKYYEITNHLGNVMATFTDKKRGIDENADGDVDYYQPDMVSSQNYYAFGSLMPGRIYSIGQVYRFGFNTQEQDNEVYGKGNLNTAKFWEYDTRLGRRWNRDPIVKPWESLYATFGNNPIYYSDVLGLDKDHPNTPNGGTDNPRKYKSPEEAEGGDICKGDEITLPDGGTFTSSSDERTGATAPKSNKSEEGQEKDNKESKVYDENNTPFGFTMWGKSMMDNFAGYQSKVTENLGDMIFPKSSRMPSLKFGDWKERIASIIEAINITATISLDVDDIKAKEEEIKFESNAKFKTQNAGDIINEVKKNEATIQGTTDNGFKDYKVGTIYFDARLGGPYKKLSNTTAETKMNGTRLTNNDTLNKNAKY
ncbi:MAG: hypothetical protein KA797_04100 [Chitinophagales bacterium]|nr:hypothetical protein [Chitinophagales bacterium]